jgi:hypothetical protein
MAAAAASAGILTISQANQGFMKGRWMLAHRLQ